MLWGQKETLREALKSDAVRIRTQTAKRFAKLVSASGDRVILQAVNSYKLNTSVNEYAKGLLLEFNSEDYQFFSREPPTGFGIRRLFEGERFFWAENTVFLGRQSIAVIASVDDLICKILFHFHIGNDDECASFKEKTLNHLIIQMGVSHEAREVGRSRLFIWSANEGNVVLEFGETEVDVVLTSSAIRSAKRRSFLKRLFRT